MPGQRHQDSITRIWCFQAWNNFSQTLNFERVLTSKISGPSLVFSTQSCKGLLLNSDIGYGQKIDFNKKNDSYNYEKITSTVELRSFFNCKKKNSFEIAKFFPFGNVKIFAIWKWEKLSYSCLAKMFFKSNCTKILFDILRW